MGMMVATLQLVGEHHVAWEMIGKSELRGAALKRAGACR